MKLFLGIIALVTLAPALFGVERDVLLARYRDKFVVVMREGLAIGVCEGHPGERGLLGEAVPVVTVSVDGDQADVRGHDFIAPPGCGRVVPEPVHRGEVLAVKHVAIHGGQLMTNVENVSPHAIGRGVGAFEHHSFERGQALLKFKLPDGRNYNAAAELVERWLHAFSSAEEAAEFGNTASGVFVKQVKLGMTFGEVESALGPPQTRVDLGEKILYKYKDMTVEFRDARVANVR